MLRNIIVDNKLNEKCLLLAQCVYTPPKPDKERILSDTEITLLYQEILQHEADYPYYMPDYAIELALLTGMRVGELSALHWTDIYDGDIHIDYSEHRVDYADRESEYFIGEPKNGKHRQFPITEDISHLFEKIKKLNLSSSEDFIFIRRDGTRFRAHDISCAVARRCDKLGIKKGSIHCIRRTVSSILNTDLPQKVVASLLGHTERVNEENYNYSRAEREEKINAISIVSSKVTNFQSFVDIKKSRKLFKIKGFRNILVSSERGGALRSASVRANRGLPDLVRPQHRSAVSSV